MIEVTDLTMTYPSGKGIFDLNFAVAPGDIMGYLGPNGAGKTTTIRALMGFMRPDGGRCAIGGRDCWQFAAENQRVIGYIPGEMAFPEGMDGDEFLAFMHALRGTNDRTMQRKLLDMFELSPGGRIKKFSKGMKQKLGIVTAFMHDPAVLILDEPTSGLDPLMQNRFVDLILAEKEKGKTILMSSHIFEEVEKTCDNVLIIKDGRIVNLSDIPSLKATRRKGFVLRCADAPPLAGALNAAGIEATVAAPDSVRVSVTADTVDTLIKTAAGFGILDLEAQAQSLDEVFMQYYGSKEESA